jgi:aminoglycoside/choline kinase family phosphotransferase
VLFDGYRDWSLEARQMLLAKAMECIGACSMEFWSELNAVSLQRNFKALGTFAYQLLAKGKTRFAPAVTRTLSHIHGHFERINHGEGVIQLRHWIKLASERLQDA